MFVLFKKRDFGDYVSDTFQFFRQTGRHYLKNYFTICGFFLLVLAFLTFFLSQVYFDFFLNIGRINNNFRFIQNYAENNLLVILLGALVIFLFIVLLSMLTYSVPVIYMDLYAKNKGNNFETKEITAKFKSDFGRILIFFLGLIFLVTPLLLLLFTGLAFLCLIIIGIPLLLFALPTAMSWITLSFYEYLNHEKNFFQSLASGFKHVMNQYFPNVCSLIIIYLIIQISMSIFTMFPYAFGMASMVVPNQNHPVSGDDALSTLKIILTIIMVVSILMSYILNNLLIINQGLVYYSSVEDDENISSKDSIDLIGSE